MSTLVSVDLDDLVYPGSADICPASIIADYDAE